MKIEQIRNATIRVDFGGKSFLVDPWLQDRGVIPPMGTSNTIPNPTVSLPAPVEEILKGIDAYIVTHIHADHFDLDHDENGAVIGGKCLNKDTKIYAQNEEDKFFMEHSGFTKAEVLSEHGTMFHQIELIKTTGVHGTINPAGPVMGIIMRAADEPTLYIAGDTIYCKEVEDTLIQYQPAVIVVNACAAYTPQTGRLIMDGEDILRVHQMLPKSKIIASHMEAVNHATVTRSKLKNQMLDAGIAEYVIIPEDGDICVF